MIGPIVGLQLAASHPPHVYAVAMTVLWAVFVVVVGAHLFMTRNDK